MKTVSNIKYTYKDTKYGATCMNIYPSLQVETDTYDEVLKVLGQTLSECKDLQIWSFETK